MHYELIFFEKDFIKVKIAVTDIPRKLILIADSTNP